MKADSCLEKSFAFDTVINVCIECEVFSNPNFAFVSLNFYQLFSSEFFFRHMCRGHRPFFGKEFQIWQDFWHHQCDVSHASSTTLVAMTNHFKRKEENGENEDEDEGKKDKIYIFLLSLVFPLFLLFISLFSPFLFSFPPFFTFSSPSRRILFLKDPILLRSGSGISSIMISSKTSLMENLRRDNNYAYDNWWRSKRNRGFIDDPIMHLPQYNVVYWRIRNR